MPLGKALNVIALLGVLVIDSKYKDVDRIGARLNPIWTGLERDRKYYLKKNRFCEGLMSNACY